MTSATQSSTTPGTVDRRDAAITAGLAGAVLVVVGYASGIGLRPPQEVAATIPDQADPPAAAPLSPVPEQVPAAVPPPAISAPVAVPAPPSVPTPPPAPTPSEPAMPMPSHAPGTTAPASPTTAPPDECSPGLVTGLVDGLPLVTDLTQVVTGLLSGLLGPVVDAVAPDDVLGCTSARATGGSS